MHGVRYLAEARNPVVRMLWLVAVCGSVCGATLIIYQNVVNWNNTPAIVTRVQPTLVKVKTCFKKDKY